jgi:hypothetical protein
MEEWGTDLTELADPTHQVQDLHRAQTNLTVDWAALTVINI